MDWDRTFSLTTSFLNKAENYITIPSPSGPLSARVFDAPGADKVLVITSATGVKQEFYSKFAHFVNRHSIAVITFDYCGIGRSLTQPIKETTTNAEAWAKNDLQSVLTYTIEQYPKAQKLLLGHSIGGQLIGLTPASAQMDKIVLVASQSGYWRYWKGAGQRAMLFNWFVLFPVLLPIFGYLPSKKITGMEKLPKPMAQQWRNWATKKNYYLDDPSLGATYFDEIHGRLTAYSIEGDRYAPRAAVNWLTSQFVNAKVETHHLVGADFDVKKIGHFGIFRDRFEGTIWTALLESLNSQ